MERRYTVPLTVALVLLNVGALWFLRERMSVVPPTEPAGTATSGGTSGEGDAAASATGAAAIKGSLLLAGADDGSVLRMTRGDCERGISSQAWAGLGKAEPAQIEVPGMTEALALGRTKRSWWVVGANDGCAVKAWFSDSLEGTARSTKPLPEGQWYLDPTDDGKVIGPRGPVSLGTGWDATSVQTLQTEVYVVCDDLRALFSTIPVKGFSQLPSADIAALAVLENGRRAELASGPSCIALFREVTDAKVLEEECLDSGKAPLGITWLGGKSVAAQIGYTLTTNADGGEFSEREVLTP